jgi:hypothetical protein
MMLLSNGAKSVLSLCICSYDTVCIYRQRVSLRVWWPARAGTGMLISCEATSKGCQHSACVLCIPDVVHHLVAVSLCVTFFVCQVTQAIHGLTRSRLNLSLGRGPELVPETYWCNGLSSLFRDPSNQPYSPMHMVQPAG